MTADRQIGRPDGRPLGAQILRNVVFGGVRILVVAPLPLLIVPFYLKRIGTNGYGTWAVFLAIVNLTSMADLGLAGTLSKHVADLRAREDFKNLRRLLGTALTLYTGIALLLAAALWVASPWLTSALLSSSATSATEIERLWRYLALIVGTNVLVLLFSSVISGLQRMDLTSLMASLNAILGAGFGVTFLLLGSGVPGLLRAALVAAAVTLGLYVWLASRLLPRESLTLWRFSWSAARELLSFSLQLYLTQVAVAVHNQIEKVYLALFGGVVAAGWYDIASDLAVKLRGVPGVVLGPIMPAAAELNARGDRAKLEELYIRGHKYLAMLGVPFVSYVVLLSRDFVTLWVGHGLAMLALPFATLLSVNFLNLATGPGYLVLVGQGNLRPGVYSATLGIALNLVLSFILIKTRGFGGAVLGTSLSLAAASLFFLWMFRRVTDIPTRVVVRTAYLKPIFAAALAALAVALLKRHGQLSWLGLVLYSLPFMAVYTLTLIGSRFLDSYDKLLARRLVRFVVPGFGHGDGHA